MLLSKLYQLYRKDGLIPTWQKIPNDLCTHLRGGWLGNFSLNGELKARQMVFQEGWSERLPEHPALHMVFSSSQHSHAYIWRLHYHFCRLSHILALSRVSLAVWVSIFPLNGFSLTFCLSIWSLLVVTLAVSLFSSLLQGDKEACSPTLY